MWRTALPDVIVLNGASSSGKTSLAKVLQERLPQCYLYFGIDAILYSLPPSDLQSMLRGEPITRPGYDYNALVASYHAAARALLVSGQKLILDNGLFRAEWRDDLIGNLLGFSTYWVGVSCEPDELRTRESRRGDRAIGTAEGEAAVVHVGVHYDVELDSTSLSPEALATVICDDLA